MDRYIRETLLGIFLLSDSQHAYCSSRSTDTALYCLSSILERTLNHKETALVVFQDIEGALDKVPFTTIFKALRERSTDGTVVRLIENLLPCRYINASLGGDDLTIRASAGCPQGGVLSPILRCLVVGSLLEDLNS